MGTTGTTRLDSSSQGPERLEDVLGALALSVVRTIDENESFLILHCKRQRDASFVLKYLRTESKDARRRLRNEALLIERARGTPLVPFLTYRAHGERYLLTDYDSGELLSPEKLRSEAVCRAVERALSAFQALRREDLNPAVVDRETTARYYLKVLAKHLLHLTPTYLTLSEARASFRAVRASLPAIAKREVVCHGDFLPTNLLYHPEEQRVTITDLEGFMTSNHPLFDAVALCTTDERPLSDWGWQSGFLSRVLDPYSEDLRAGDCRRAFRGILTFFLVYRLNEARLHAEGTSYFDGLPKGAYLRRRVLGLPVDFARRRVGEGELEHEILEIRRRNLRQVLSDDGFERHLDLLMAGARSEPALAGS
jgi:hypothetical protein